MATLKKTNITSFVMNSGYIAGRLLSSSNIYHFCGNHIFLLGFLTEDKLAASLRIFFVGFGKIFFFLINSFLTK